MNVVARLLSVFIVWGIAWCSAASAQDNNALRVSLDPCVSVNKDALRIALDLELQAQLVAFDAVKQYPYVTIACASERVELVLQRSAEVGPLKRTIAWENSDEGTQRRWLVLAVGELLEASRYSEPRSAHAAQMTAVVERKLPSLMASLGAFPAASPDAAFVLDGRGAERLEALHALHVTDDSAQEVADAYSTRLVLTGGGLSFEQPTSVLVGVGIGLERSYPVGPTHLGWSMALQVATGEFELEEGFVEAYVGALSGGLTVGACGDGIGFCLCLEGLLGMVDMTGEAEQFDLQNYTLVRPWAALIASPRLDVQITSHLFVRFAVEAGVVVLPVDGTLDGHQIVAIDGLLLGADVGLGIAWP